MEVSGRTELAGPSDWHEVKAYKDLPEKSKQFEIERKTKFKRAENGADAVVRSSRRNADIVSADVSGMSSSLIGDLPGGRFSDDDEITNPGHLRDGQIIFMTIPQNMFFLGRIDRSVSLVEMDVTTAASTQIYAKAGAAGLTPIEYLRRVRQLLIDNDNLLGPQRVMSTAYEQLKVIRALRRKSDGKDRQQLMELQAQFAEFTVWLHQDAGEFCQAEYWLDRALQWSHFVGDPDLTCFVMARKSQLAIETHDTAEVIDLAEAGRSMTRPGTRLAAVCRTYEVVGHGLCGNSAASNRAFEKALSEVNNLGEDSSSWAPWLNIPYIEVHRAQVLDTIGEHVRAGDIFATAIAQHPETYYRDRGVFLAREAVVRARAAEPEQAAVLGVRLLNVAADTGSGRIFRELVKLNTALQQWKDLDEVADFRTALDGMILQNKMSLG